MSDGLQLLLSAIFYWAILLSPLLATAIFAAMRRRHGLPILKPSLLLLAPAVPWMLFFAYAALNRWEDVSHPKEIGPVVGAVSLVVLYGTPVMAAVAVLLAKGYRRWALLVGVLNAVVGMATAFLAIMMTSGNWI
ncbi:MAG: hypothetical protein Q7T19_00800 [Caulobacter sp.]|nr:hypothetical protein [Caulobacter sp.]